MCVDLDAAPEARRSEVGTLARIVLAVEQADDLDEPLAARRRGPLPRATTCRGVRQLLYHGPHPERLVRSVNFLEFVTPKQNSETVVEILRANWFQPPFSIFDLGNF